ncbi:hypothetical protein EL22_00070 [Halostagnicola sp. A56]|uniref:hypothetical protein n=1 Tax=Halostagnicola sp. A56 TaxID=1495067 RepID=UPI0004A06D35|nr:hypothetical protein [Halostagnicola sp. A56]KDE60622.1 hypothetical protein EL22_00070 [Halostagnicola sp. A56]
MPDDTVTVRVAGPQFRFDREQYSRGDTLDVPGRIAVRHPRTLEIVDGDDASDEHVEESSEPTTLDVDELDPHPADLKVSELKDRLEDVDDVELLKAIRKAEDESEDRSTAKNAIDARLAELEG